MEQGEYEEYVEGEQGERQEYLMRLWQDLFRQKDKMDKKQRQNIPITLSDQQKLQDAYRVLEREINKKEIRKSAKPTREPREDIVPFSS